MVEMKRITLSEFLKRFPKAYFYCSGDVFSDTLVVESFTRLDRKGDPACFYIDANGPAYQMVCYRDEQLALRVCILKLPPVMNDFAILRTV